MSDSWRFGRVTDFLRIEAEAITQTAARLDSAEVLRAVALLERCAGKVVVTGVGKSGIVAEKIAATLSSTGCAAVYLHASDALHGGLGVVAAKDDVVIALSNSGETFELIEVLPFLKNRRVPVIAIVGNLQSTLARRADVRLDASVDQEACPLNLAPTTSTTVALAIGDALAMTLMEIKNWTPEKFASNHPAGRLGKRLTLTVADLMHADAHNPTVKINATWLEIIACIGRGGLGAVCVVDEAKHLLGIITDGDLRRALQRIKHADLENLTCEAIMTADPIVARPDLLAYDALRLMEDRPTQISVLPVINGARVCIGLIRIHDIVRSGL
ncbi:MAG: KpsF/GutQ family sugar-phosphate isomerase [Pyrinomonadaceae bacterium]